MSLLSSGGRAEGGESLQCVVSWWWIRGLEQEGKGGEVEGEGQRVARVDAMALFVEIAGHLPARETRGAWSNSTRVNVDGAWESRSSPRPILDHVADTVTSREPAGKYALCYGNDAGAEDCRSYAWRPGRGCGTVDGDGKGTGSPGSRFCRDLAPMRPPIRGSQSPPRPRHSGDSTASSGLQTPCILYRIQNTEHRIQRRSSQSQQQDSVLAVPLINSSLMLGTHTHPPSHPPTS